MEFVRSALQLYSRYVPFQLIPTKPLLFANKAFRDQYRFLVETESWTLGDAQSWQLNVVKDLLRSAWEGVPAYKELYSASRIHYTDINSIRDLKQLPLTDKSFHKTHADKLVNSQVSRFARVARNTGGSTGAPMRFLLDKSKIFKEKAFFYYINEKNGYITGEKCVLLKGDNYFDKHGDVGHYDPGFNYLRLDSNYLNRPEFLARYDDRIRKFQSDFLLGYPSSIYQLALSYLAAGVEAPRFKLIMFASENTYGQQMQIIRRVFRCDNLFYHYGHSEYAAMAFKYRDYDGLGFVPYYGFTELIGEDPTRELQPGETGEIVATGFSYAQPFIRYRTNDFAVLSDYRSNDFMRTYLPVERIEGRLQEFIVTRDKRLVSICTMGAAHFSELETVQDTQYVQEQEGKVFFDVVCDDKTFTPALVASIQTAIAKKLDNKAEVTVRRVDEIPRTAVGKKSMINQKLDIARYLAKPADLAVEDR
jgi:phenylacetate-CoA ligase